MYRTQILSDTISERFVKSSYLLVKYTLDWHIIDVLKHPEIPGWDLKVD